MSSFSTKKPCKLLIQYHMIFVTKYRRKILEPICESVLSEMVSIADSHDFSIKAKEIDKDHIHPLIESAPTISPSQICMALKQKSTFLTRNGEKPHPLCGV